MQYKNFICFLITTCFFCIASVSVCAQETQTSALVTSSIPDWIKPLQLPLSSSAQEAQSQNGVYYLMVDRQIKVDERQPLVVYHRFSEKVVNQNGLQSVSNINVNYDPSYEALQWHHLHVIRNGKIIDRQSDVKIAILHREKELENSIYNGRLTANIILSDLRVGDILDYSYSSIGQNPIYAGHFSDAEYLDWSVPIGKLHFFLSWGKPQKLQFKAVHTKALLNITPLAERTLYEYDLNNTVPIKSNSQSPSWYDPYGRYYFSDVETWQNVIDWAIPLYQSAIKPSPVIKTVVEEIKTKSNSVSQQAALALHYVQDNIRYLGVEMGKNSHQPSLATDTLNRRYGDCKDKAVLLITILRELGVFAAPVLVNTDSRKELINQIPAITAFDHVIVYAKVNGVGYWIDPTREYQKGDLEVLFQANYGYGLVIDKEYQTLLEMNVPRNTTEKIVEEFDISGAMEDPVTYTIHSEYTGYEAEAQRSGFLGSNITEKSDQYLNFYKGYYDHIRIQGNISYEDNARSGTFKVAENYLIHPFWETDEHKKSTTTFYASGISTALSKPEEIVRTAPYYVRQREIKEIIKVKLDDVEWGFKDSRYEEKNDFFVFNSVVIFDKENQQLTLEYYYKTLMDSIPATDIPTYLAARKKVMDQVEYAIYKNGGLSSDATGEASSDSSLENILSSRALWFGLAGFVYFMALIALLNNWYTDKSRLNYLVTTKFYPVAPLKFFILSLVTMGFYQVYWFYRNWSYVKRVDGEKLFPFWRAFFSCFWFYPFYRRLVRGEEAKDIILLPSISWFAAVLALLYLLLTCLSSVDNYGIVFQFLSVLICLSLVLHIDKIPQIDDLSFKNNSRWLFRHYLLVLVFLPLYLLVAGQDLGLLPATDVVNGNRLYAHDLRFLQRHRIIPARERVLYFYSTAIFNLHDAGNGFTEKTVFSYWHDEEGKLTVKNVPFTKINNISENPNSGPLDDKTLSLTDDDGDEFNLYLGSSKTKNNVFIKKILEQWQQQRVLTKH